MKQLSLVCCLLTIGLVQRSQCSDESSKSELSQLYSDYANAVRAINLEKMASFFAADISMIGPDGKIHDSAEMKQYQRVNAETTRKINNYSSEIEAITNLPDGQVAVIVLQNYDRDQAPLDAPQTAHNIRTSVVQRETWKKEASGWKLRKVEEILAGPVFFDGKPMGR
jgi:hypothetical protein